MYVGSKEGKIAAQEYENKIKELVEKELKKYHLPIFDSKEESINYQEELRRAIKERIRDRMI